MENRVEAKGFSFHPRGYLKSKWIKGTYVSLAFAVDSVASISILSFYYSNHLSIQDVWDEQGKWVESQSCDKQVLHVLSNFVSATFNEVDSSTIKTNFYY